MAIVCIIDQFHHADRTLTVGILGQATELFYAVPGEIFARYVGIHLGLWMVAVEV